MITTASMPLPSSEALESGYIPLAVHYAARAQGVAHALVHSVAEGNFYILRERFQHAYAHAADNILGIFECRPPVQGRLYLYVQTVGFDVPLAQLCDHVQVVPVYVRKRDLDVTELRYRKYVCQQPPGKAYGTGSDKRYFHIAPAAAATALRKEPGSAFYLPASKTLLPHFNTISTLIQA